ncbi:MAG TPA: TauD/TfdA family dioxygenase [Burkholderiales bacterium]|jgi:taurine dioxygenase|nr:TauD/TfdA family dioxygenase [Burkholderiales bacterium]
MDLPGNPGMTVVPTGASLGADVIGVDLSRRIDSLTFKAIEDAWHQHLVLRFRGQQLDDPGLLRFARLFGELDKAPVHAGHEVEDPFPEITVMSNIKVNGRSIGNLGHYEAEWHTDMSYNERTPIGSLLYSIEVPAVGGDTGFANMYAAYDTLPVELKRAIVGMQCRHDSSRNSAGELRKGQKEVADPRDTPGAVHPIIRTHPATRRNALFLGRRRNAYIIGLGLAESEDLLDKLWTHATQRRFAWYQQWKVGDLILWDNRCAMHRRDAFDPESRRLMHRTQVRGDKPFFDPATLTA